MAALATEGGRPPLSASALNRLGVRAYKSRNYDLAERCFRHVSSLDGKELNWPLRAVALLNLARTYQAQRRDEEAARILALTMHEEAKEPFLGATMKVARLKELALAYLESGRRREAQEAIRSAFELTRGTLGDFDPATISMALEAARLFESTNNIDDAESMLCFVLKQPGHDRGARARHLLHLCKLVYQSQMPDSEKFAGYAGALRQVLAPGDARLSLLDAMIAARAYANKQATEGDLHWRKVHDQLPRLARELKALHRLDLARILQSLALFQEQNGYLAKIRGEREAHWQKARSAFEDALSLLKGLPGGASQRSDVESYYQGMLIMTGREREARARVSEFTLQNHSSAYSLASGRYFSNGQAGKALAMAEMALSYSQAIHDPLSHDVTSAYAGAAAGRAALLLKRYRESERYSKIAIDCGKRAWGAESVQLASHYVVLGEALTGQNRRQESRQCFQHALGLMKRHGVAVSDSTYQSCLEALARSSGKEGDRSKASTQPASTAIPK